MDLLAARLSGARLVRGFLLYNVACALGALANYAVSGFLFSRGRWPGVAAAVAGALVGTACNYTMSRLAWKQ